MDIALKQHPKARLVVIDTLAKVRMSQRRNQSTYEYDYQSVQGIKRLADNYRVSILVVHHTRKADSDDVLGTISGSFGLSGGVDGILILARSRSQAEAELHISGRDIEEATLALNFNYPYWTSMGAAEELRLNENQQAIISVLKNANRGMSPKDISSALSARGLAIANVTLRQSLPRMAKKGLIKSSGYGKYESLSPVVAHASLSHSSQLSQSECIVEGDLSTSNTEESDKVTEVTAIAKPDKAQTSQTSATVTKQLDLLRELLENDKLASVRLIRLPSGKLISNATKYGIDLLADLERSNGLGRQDDLENFVSSVSEILIALEQGLEIPDKYMPF